MSTDATIIAAPPVARTRSSAGALGLTILALSVAVGFALRGVLSPVQEAARQSLHFDDNQMGLLQGLAAAIPITVLSLPLGRMVDRMNRVRLLIALTALAAVGTLMTAMVHSFALMFVARMLAGAAGLCALPAAISIAADISAPQQRGRALLVLSFGQYVGTAAAFALGGGLLGHLGATATGAGPEPWRAVLLIFGVAGLLLVAPLFLLREPARHEIGEAADPPLGPVLRELWSYRAFLAPLVIGQMATVMADTAAAVWAAPVLARNYAMSPQAAGGWLGAIVLGAGLIGSVVGGVVADLGQKSPKPGGLLLGAIVAAALAIPAAAFAAAPTPGLFFALLALLLICGATAGLVTTTALAVLIPNELRGVCLGAFVVVGGIVGFGIAPSLVSLVSGALGGGHSLGPSLTGVDLAVGLCSLAGFVVARAHCPAPRR